MAQQALNFDPAVGDDTTAALRKLDNNIADLLARLGAIGGQFPITYISGLMFARASANTVAVYAGAAWIPGLSKVIEVQATVFTPAAALAASSMYHLYLYQNNGVTAAELSGTPPTAYAGFSYIKSGDGTRRYLGSLVTDASGSIIDFWCPRPGALRYITTIGTMRPVSNGLATSAAAVSVSNVVPITARGLAIQVYNGGSPATGFVGIAANTQLINVQPGLKVIMDDLPITSPAFTYNMSGATNTAGLYVDVLGYSFER
jgi:hypothetical protein